MYLRSGLCPNPDGELKALPWASQLVGRELAAPSIPAG